jgi:hypothetical protein
MHETLSRRLDAISPAIHVCRRPSGSGYTVTRSVPASELVTASLVPSLAILASKLANLRLK